MNAFLTGSRVYGTPREDSDLDIVIRADLTTIRALTVAAGGQPPAESGPGPSGVSIRFGALNVIAVGSDEAYMAWRTGTEELKLREPVTREQAVEVLKAKFAALKEETVPV